MKTCYINAEVYTGRDALAEAFAVEDGRFLLAGTREEVLSAAEPESPVVDLQGRFVCCGFNDSHMHLVEYGDALRAAQLHAHTDSLEGMIRYLRDFLRTHPVPEGGWLYGRGWNQDYFTDADRMPNRWDLDRVSTEVPIAAVRACGHCMTANTRLLELLGITEDTPEPPGGTIGKQNGQLDGLFFDNAMDLILPQIPAPTQAEILDMIRESCRELNARGVTSCQTDDYGFSRKVPVEQINEAYRMLAESGELTVRVYEQCNFTNLPELRQFVESGNNTGRGDEMFRLGPLKMVADGALGARTAYMTQPYADDPTTVGLSVFTQETMDEMVDYANAHGMQVAIHAIGDACLDRVLHAVEGALNSHPREDHRHGVVHCQITRADQLEKLRDLNMIVYAQTIFLDYDSRIVEQRVGPELASTSYNWKTLMDWGVSVSNGTDCPVELPDAMAGIQCAVTRASLRDPEKPYLPDQAFSVREALDSYTIRGAWASFEEKIKGRIEPGYLADFVVLDENPFRVPANRLAGIPIRAAYLGGRRVFSRADQ